MEQVEVIQSKKRHEFVIQKVQPALLGLMDGSVSTLAPLFATAGLTGQPMNAFYVGLAASLVQRSAWDLQRHFQTMVR